MIPALRLADIGLLSGLLAGLAVAIGSRIVMRIVALADPSGLEFADVSTGVTGETLFLLLIVPLSAVKGGLLFVLIRSPACGA